MVTKVLPLKVAFERLQAALNEETCPHKFTRRKCGELLEHSMAVTGALGDLKRSIDTATRRKRT